MFGTTKIFGSSYRDEYYRTGKGFYISFDYLYVLKDLDLNCLGLLMTYFDDSYDLFDKEYKKVKEYWIKRLSQVWNPKDKMKYASHIHHLQSNWDAFREKWGNINNHWITGQELLDSESDRLSHGSAILIPIKVPYEDKDNTWNNGIKKLETGIFNLTLSEKYKAYTLHEKQFENCPGVEKELAPYDDNFKNWVQSEIADAILVTSSVHNDLDLKNWATSYAAELHLDPITDVSDISKYLISRTEVDVMPDKDKDYDAWAKHINKLNFCDTKQGFMAHDLSCHGELIKYERIIRDEYFQELETAGKDICISWGDRYQQGSEELAVLIKNSFVYDVNLQYHYLEAKPKKEKQIKSKIVPNPGNKLSRRETLLRKED